MEYLVTMSTQVPEGTPDKTVEDIRTCEAARSRELAAQGRLLRLWRPPLQPGEWRTLGLFTAADSGQLEGVLASMPLRVRRADEVTPLSPHPNDPALARSLNPCPRNPLTRRAVARPASRQPGHRRTRAAREVIGFVLNGEHRPAIYVSGDNTGTTNPVKDR